MADFINVGFGNMVNGDKIISWSVQTLHQSSE